MASRRAEPARLDLEKFACELQPVVARHPEIAAVWIFGSALRGQLRFDSDVDVAVLFRKNTAVDRDLVLAELGARLEALASPYPVDAVDLGAQGVIFAHGVLCTGRRVYEADRDWRVDFESTTCVRAFDFKPTHDLAVRGQRDGILRRLDDKEAG
jgi:predicted nucleotidyltransferase